MPRGFLAVLLGCFRRFVLGSTPGGGEGEDDERRPDEGEGEEVAGGKWFVVDGDADEEGEDGGEEEGFEGEAGYRPEVEHFFAEAVEAEADGQGEGYPGEAADVDGPERSRRRTGAERLSSAGKGHKQSGPKRSAPGTPGADLLKRNNLRLVKA